MKALVIVDVQNDFCPGGSLGTERGADVAAAITEYARGDHGYDYVVATKDWHIDPGEHFEVWPVHCVAGTSGAEFHPNLQVETDEVFYKGQYTAAYSGFEGASEAGESMEEWLTQRGVTELDVVGIATDFCVKATAIDGLEKFQVRVLTDLCAPVADEAEAFAALAAAGATVQPADA
ncbi:isochorismatase family protein [Corynebacterium sp. 153RC1]|uniref:isochorismatase family protein n=1 Tax=Corynebacterium TaxID=1716 RepID=UPI00211C0F4D|nr:MULTISPECIES: isochorismatase family protein [unclassified Corynebacterium]MCQ9370859.1 isochorismatase family protein [Corynebacterium sp. 35RC1]MCQ9343264.1 isochorismatase family protein [Corynebacterium sp. 76QC2CO]MCQ9353188.1 isochorismatase family protein [Corynebacterium sp. 209RC1]MCQ9355517.1 isochorismatase family protein [Corynebacterium sp. 1222RC1]MCQ9357686.1 isochorismatase family protein [Corynebacterium sp. 122RC1]